MTYPEFVCFECGVKYGRHQARICTVHEGVCGVCGKTASVTEPRDFGHLVLPDAIVVEMPQCPCCQQSYLAHAPKCPHQAVIELALEMWWYIYQLEGQPVSGDRCGGFEDRLSSFLFRDAFPSRSSASSAVPIMPRVLLVSQCGECRHNEKGRCQKTTYKRNKVPKRGVPSWCPLPQLRQDVVL